jgi:hypothetical protein
VLVKSEQRLPYVALDFGAESGAVLAHTMGETQMGRYKFSSWTLHMASISSSAL